MKVKREFRDEWKDKFKWLKSSLHEGMVVMKCIYCETYKSIGPWGTGNGCTSLQHDALVTHAHSNNHKISQAKWVCGNERKAKSIPEHIRVIDDINKEKSS